MFENLYTTKMSADKRKLQSRFSKIRSKNGKLSKSMAFVISVVLIIAVLCATIVMAVVSKNGKDSLFENTLLTLNTDKREGDKYNFLILGLDASNRADTVMLLCVDENKIEGLSIPRDTAFTADIADGEIRKISDILAEEDGDQKVVDAIRNKFDVSITYYAKVKLSAVKDIVDSVGGINFDVPMNMEYEDPHQNLYINLKQGNQILSGTEICGLLQYRRSNNGPGYSMGDITRIETGQLFIKEFINQKLNKEYIKKVPELSEILAHNIETNYSFTNIVSDVKIIEQLKSNFDIKTVPGELVALDNGIVVYEIDREKLMKP